MIVRVCGSKIQIMGRGACGSTAIRGYYRHKADNVTIGGRAVRRRMVRYLGQNFWTDELLRSVELKYQQCIEAVVQNEM